MTNIQWTKFEQKSIVTKYKGFCARLGPRRKSRSLLYWNSRRKIGVAMHYFEIISHKSRQNCWHQQFSEKEGNAQKNS